MKVRLITLYLLLNLIIFSPVLISAPDNYFYNHHQERELSLQSPLLYGNDVWELQRELRQLGFYRGKINSYYDWKTYLAVRKFQYTSKLSDTGVVTAEVWLSLGQAIHNQTSIRAGSNLRSKESNPQGIVSILVNTYEKRLIVYSDAKKYAEFPVAVGKYSTKSPVGEFKIIEKVDMWDKSAFGDKWMRLSVPWGNYGIHGTNKPGSIGYASSNGCIRMFNKDVAVLYSWVKVGTIVKIVGYREPITIDRILKPGHKGKDVLLFQEKLREFGFDPNCTDGRFGEDTKRIMRELKYIYGFNDDLIADENIFYLLNIK
ncbi:L,D-transpeptidase family protein [Orenia marismortui]|uniref:Putative peptidoglycan binding protein n=1 Tax=Orenia marismortui TaxID=46469 RepID=A0A4R8H930_9FIRM|nr:L,D-transpeptidase family protein [Orenia marismortui]TDX51503.1 putative peptidoglycan binding protein [Orenia marismortui]